MHRTFLGGDDGFVNHETLDQNVEDGGGDEDGIECSTVVHTRETFIKFLRPVVLASELKDVAQACYLSNLAYIISEIKVCFERRSHVAVYISAGSWRSVM